MDRAACIRRDWNHPTKPAPSRAVCWVCGSREQATIHGDDVWWQHEYEAAILTKAKSVFLPYVLYLAASHWGML